MSRAIIGQSRRASGPPLQPDGVGPFRDGGAHAISMRRLGAWSAQAMVVLVAVYVVVFVVGFADLGNTSKPLPDPDLAIAEILILIMAPIMVTLMLATAPRRRPSPSLRSHWDG